MPASRPCPRCRANVAANSNRCFACGNRIERPRLSRDTAAPADAPPTAVAPKKKVKSWLVEPPRVVAPKKKGWWEYDLDETQKRILAAAARGETIVVYGGEGEIEGEVKAGSERFYGNASVEAVAGLVEPGLLRPVEDDAYELTDDGACLATSLMRSA